MTITFTAIECCPGGNHFSLLAEVDGFPHRLSLTREEMLSPVTPDEVTSAVRALARAKLRAKLDPKAPAADVPAEVSALLVGKPTMFGVAEKLLSESTITPERSVPLT